MWEKQLTGNWKLWEYQTPTVQRSIVPNFHLKLTVDSIHFINVIWEKQSFPPCHQAPLAYKRVHSFAAQANGRDKKWISISVPQLMLLDKNTSKKKKKTKRRLIAIPVSTASASFVFQCFAMFSESGSSGFGALRSAWMLVRNNDNNLIVSDPLFSPSKHTIKVAAK